MSILPVFEMCLQVTAWHAERTRRRQRTGDRQLIQQLVHQNAGAPADLQLQMRAVQRTKVPFLQEAAQAAGTEGVATWCIQGLN